VPAPLTSKHSVHLYILQGILADSVVFWVGPYVPDAFSLNHQAVLDRNPCVFQHFVLEFYMGISNWLGLIGLNVRVYSDNLMLERWIS
jgi:hypothetical protein